MSLLLLFRFLCFPLCLALSSSVWALEADFRLKWFGTLSTLPKHDVLRVQGRTRLIDQNFDLRSIFRQDLGPVRLLVDHSLILLSGDAASGGGLDSSVDQTVSEDNNRLWDLTWGIESGKRHRSLHRLDRLALQWQPGDWSFTVGRQALSWGSGMVFQPMDLFSPFSPTVVDRDYKAGDDLVLVDRLLSNGHDLQLLHVVRRDSQRDVSSQVSSTALKWHGYAGALEFELVAAKHYDENVYALSARVPLGQAMLRSDVVASRDLRGDWRYSGIVNADVTFLLADRNAYLFAEYFRNGWGVNKLPSSPLLLPEELQQRLQRGELFNLMKDYAALGVRFEWHPLLSQTATLISNLRDSSSLIQIQFSYNSGDHQSLEFGWIEPLGASGDEFGGVPVFGDAVTTGGASRIYVRWVYYL